ncbi:SusC/RagA family TonB-linked outer membrane protein [Flavobacterium sp.]
MRSKFKWIFTLLLALSMQFSFAQEKTVTGVVSDKSGPIPGANVVVKGTTRSTQTDFDGKYAIKASQGEVLVISFTGYTNATITVGGASNYNVSLKEASNILEEVVVLGYDRTATKPKSVAAITTVSAESIKNRPNVTVLQSLQGNVAGLNIITSSGSPGSAKFDLLIRGLGSVNSSTEPLYIMDGVPTNSVVFRNINPEDIESVSVLRDAAATSIYGSRAANGVVLIRTKTGKFDGALKISYSSTYGISELTKDKYNLMNSQQLLTFQRDNGFSAGAGSNALLNSFLGRDPSNLDPLTDQEILRAPNTDWRDVFFTTSQTQSHNLSFTSGGKNLNNFTSLSYIEQDGIVKTTNFKRFTYRTNLTGKSNNDKFNYGTNLTLALSKRFQLGQETNSAINNNVVQNPLLGSLTGVPYYGEDFYPGSGRGLFDLIGTDFDGGNTTLVLQDLMFAGNQPNRYNEVKMLGNFNASYKLNKYFTLGTRVGVDYNVSDRVFARAPWSYLAIAVQESNALPAGGFETRTTDRDFGFNATNSLKYSKVFAEKHSLDAGIYMEYIKAYQTINSHTQNGLDPLTYAFGAGTGWLTNFADNPNLRPTNLAIKNVAGTFSYFGTLSYDYADKYGIDATIRRDASYRFVDDNKWGTFWSVGGRWNIDKENFMKNSVFNMLKLRASYGVQGNQNLLFAGNGVNPLYTADNLVRDLIGTGTGYGNSVATVLTQFGNNTLKWEEQSMANIGLDFGIWKDRLTGNVDVYERTTNDLFLFKPLSASAGAGPTLDGNNGSLSNKGIEVALRYKIFRGNDFNLEVFANGSYNKNEYTDVETAPNPDASVIEQNGGQINEYWVVPYAGVNPANGQLLFYDINGNLTESPGDDDRRATGKSYIPIYQGGFGFNMDYKGFFVDAQFAYSLDQWRFDYAQLWLNSPSFAPDNNMSTDILNAWTPTNTNTNIPSLGATNFTLATDLSDNWLKDASFVRLKNFSVGYSFSKKMLEKSFMTSLKLFMQAENLYTWTKWRGFDPDFGSISNVGSFPTPRTVSFGLNVEF